MNRETRSILVSVLVGGVIGWVVGVLQLIYIGSAALNSWAYMPMIPIYSGIGGALYGMIFGGSGMFAERHEAEVEASSEPSRPHAA